MKKILAVISLAIVILSCQSNKSLTPAENPDETIEGIYSFQSSSMQNTVFLYGDGMFWESIKYSLEDEIYSDAGKYTYDQDSQTIIFHYIYSEDGNYTAYLDKGDDSYTYREDQYFKISDLPDRHYTHDEIVQKYQLLYKDEGETYKLEMILDSEGGFKDITYYPDIEDVYIEVGKYTLFEDSGCIYFEYFYWPDGNFYGKYDAESQTLFTIEGNYSVIE